MTASPTTVRSLVPNTLIASNTWIRENTKLDIAYLNNFKDTDEFYTVARAELAVTEPRTDDIPRQKAICGENMDFWRGAINVNDMCKDDKIIAQIDFMSGAVHRGQWTNSGGAIMNIDRLTANGRTSLTLTDPD